MSSLTGVAQFTNRFAQNIMGYNKEKENEAERVADKERELARQAQQDKNAQENHDVTYQANTLRLDEAKDTRTESTNARNYGKTYNRVQYLKQLGDESGAIDAIVEGANSHSDLPYKINVDRDVHGKVASRVDENGNKYYYQNIIDKETGKVIRTDSVTYDQLMNGYTQLQNGQSIAAEKAAYEAERRKALDENKDKLSLKLGEAKIDDAKDANKAQRDYIYKVDELGIKHGYTVDLEGIKHGYTIDLEGIKHANAVDLSNVNAQNNIGIRTAQSDLDAGGTPIVGGAATVNSIIQSLTGTESSGNSAAFRTNTDGKSYGGLIQMGDDRLKDYAKVTKTKPISASQFKNLPASQQRAVNEWHINDLMQAAQATGAVGKSINGVPVTLGGLVAVAHLGGKGGMQKFIQTNGRYNPSDQLGTSLTDYLAKHSSGGVQVQRSVPGVPKLPKGSKKAESGKGIATSQDYNASIDKGVNTAIKSAKQLGIKPDVATTATFARAGTKLKEMGKAKNETEFLGLYQEAFDLVIDAVPERSRKKMSKADQNALGHKVLLSMVGASSLGNLKEIVYKINPSARGNGGSSATAGGLTLNLPGQQPQPRAPARQTPQVGKLQGLYARGLPAPKTDPKATENLNYLENLNDNMDW